MYINTRINKQKVKECDIPVEVLFNKEIDEIKREERQNKINLSRIRMLKTIGPIQFIITDNFAGEKEIESVVQGKAFKANGKGVVKYIVDGEIDNQREIVYDRNIPNQQLKNNNLLPIEKDEIKIPGFQNIKKMKPFLYPKISPSKARGNQKSGRYVEMIKKVINKIKEIKLEEINKMQVEKSNCYRGNNEDQEEESPLNDAVAISEMIDTNFEVIQPNLDYIMERPLDDKYLNFKQSFSVKRKIQLSKVIFFLLKSSFITT